MTQRITRKDLKRNELAATVNRTVDYVSHHRRGVTESIVIGAAAVLLVAGIVAFRIYGADLAGRELSARSRSWRRRSQASRPRPALPRPTRRRRNGRAPPSLSCARQRPIPGRLPAAPQPSSWRPETPNRRGRGTVFARVAREGRAEVAAAAEIDAARLLAAQGKTTEAAERLKRAIESPTCTPPRTRFSLPGRGLREGRPRGARGRPIRDWSTTIPTPRTARRPARSFPIPAVRRLSRILPSQEPVKGRRQ